MDEHPTIVPIRKSLKLLYGFGLAAVIGFAVIVALSVVYLRQQSEGLAVTNSRSLARSLELIFVGQINTIDAMLLAASDEIEHQLSGAHVPPQRINDYLVSLGGRLPYTDAIRATNAQGDVIYGSGLPLPPSNVADRDYFIQLRDDPTPGLLVVNPILSRIDKQWVWPFVRRINKADGSFAGVVFAPMRTTDIEKLLTQVQLEHSGIIGLRDKDFGLIARYQLGGKNEIPIGDRKLSTKFREMFKVNPLEGSYTVGAGESIDGISRTYSYRRNPKYQFLISDGLDTDIALASWRQQAWIAVGLLLVFSAAVLTVVLVRRKAWIQNEKAAAEREQLESEHQTALNLLQKVANSAPGMVYQYLQRADGSSCFPFVSDAIASIYRVTPDEAREDASKVFVNIHPEDYDAVVASIQTSARDLTPWHPEYRVKFDDGTVRWLLGNANPQRDSEGSVLWHGFVTDITANKAAEQALKRSEALLHISQAQMEASQQISATGSWVYNLETNKIWGSAEGLRLFGYAPVARNFPLDEIENCIPDRGRVHQALLNLIGEGHAYDLEYTINPADGSQSRIVHSLAQLETDSQNKPALVVGFVQDITGRKQGEADLLAAKAEAELANNAKSRFLAAASHDLRQPLAALTLYVGVLKARATAQDSALVYRIEACCTGLTELLTDLLDVSKLDAGVVSVNLSDFAVDELLESLAMVHAGDAAIKGLRLHLRPSPGVIAHTDHVLLTRMASNLIANAIRYTHRGGILVACRRRLGRLWLEVWDTGVGISADKTDHVFQEFTQLENTESSAGSGLGLSIVAKTAALLGLQIRLQSRLGRGSLFAIELPAGRLSVAPTPVQSPLDSGRLRIGLVEDNAQVLAALALALETAGHAVIAATNAADLLNRLGQQAPDIVISDYRLAAGETGVDVVRATRAVFGGTLPALIMTGDTDPTLMRSTTRLGISIQYKPLRIDTLQAAIRQATECWPV